MSTDNRGNSNVSGAIASTIAAAVNLLVLLVLCLGLMPQVDRSIEEAARNREQIAFNREIMRSIARDLQAHGEVIKRFSNILDDATIRYEKSRRERDRERDQEAAKSKEGEKKP